jgi:selenocysteine lyase/cysteine desulfurase
MNDFPKGSSSRRHFLRRMGAVGMTAAVAGPASACAPRSQVAVSPPTVWPTDDNDFWRMVRKQYPLTLDRTYLNTGGLGPATYSALDAMRETQMDLARVSETGHNMLERARETVAAFLGAAASEIAFVRNATEGNATVASGLSLAAGDEVIFESHAHPGGAIPWMTRQKETGVKVRIFEPDPLSADGNLQRIADLLTDRTRVVQVSHITAPTGILMPVNDIAALCRDRGIWFHVDGAQSAGMIPVDLHAITCDSYATSGHKWIGAPHGTGVLYVKHDRLNEVVPTESGAYSNAEYELPDVFGYVDTAQRFEPGTRDVPSVVGFEAAVAFMESITMDRVAEYSRGLATYLHEGLSAINGVRVLTPSDPALRGAMTTYKVDGVAYDELNSRLGGDFKLRCRIVTERGLDALRISTHIFNSRADCDRVVEGTRAVMGR